MLPYITATITKEIRMCIIRIGLELFKSTGISSNVKKWQDLNHMNILTKKKSFDLYRDLNQQLQSL